MKEMTYFKERLLNGGTVMLYLKELETLKKELDRNEEDWRITKAEGKFLNCALRR